MDNNNLITGNPVCVLTGEEFLPKEGMTFVQQVESFFKKQGGIAYSQFGKVLLDKKGVKSDKEHSINRIKTACFAAVKDVLGQGCIVLLLRRYNIHNKKTGDRYNSSANSNWN